ncbi:hypothetical protein ACLKA6_010857 [Drosophila palustris]
MASGGIRPHNGFDFKQLCETFSQICPDFRGSQTEKSQSLDFANKVLFDLGPKMHQIKQSGSGQMWRLIFSGGDSVFIYSYTFKSPINVNPRVHDKKLYLTLKQAGLLAVNKLCSVLPDLHNPRDKILLTPLARAVFAPQNISNIATALTVRLGRAVESGEVVKAVISSCQTDGFHLPHSQCHIALVAIEVTVTSSSQREKLRLKTLRLYAKMSKTFDEAQYNIYAQYSKLDKRPPDVELPQPSTSDPGNPSHIPGKSISTVLRSIARTVDDPLSGGTIDIDFVEHSVTQNEIMPTPVVLQVEATTLDRIKLVNLLPK